MRRRRLQRTQRKFGEVRGLLARSPRPTRTLSVRDWMMTMLAEHLAARGITGASNEAFVFVNSEGAPLHYSNRRRRTWLPDNVVGRGRCRHQDSSDALGHSEQPVCDCGARRVRLTNPPTCLSRVSCGRSVSRQH
jgi:hypothetical protein